MCGSRLYSLPSSYESSSVFRAIQFQFNIGAFATFASSSASPPPPLCLSRISPFFLRDTRLFTSILILLKVLSCLLVTISKKKNRGRYWNAKKIVPYVQKHEARCSIVRILGESAGFVVIVSCASQILRKVL